MTNNLDPRPLAMDKDPESWARVTPAAALGGSRAQAENVLAMAIADIGRLARHCDKLHAEFKKAMNERDEAVARLDDIESAAEDRRFD